MLECLSAVASAGRARVVLFDFDGTLSLIRAGWVDVMVPMMVEILLELKTGETEQELTARVTEFERERFFAATELDSLRPGCEICQPGRNG